MLTDNLRNGLHEVSKIVHEYEDWISALYGWTSGVPKGGWGWGVQNPPPEIPKALQNRAKTQPDLWKLLKIAGFRMPTPQDVRRKGSKILKLPRFAVVYISNDK